MPRWIAALLIMAVGCAAEPPLDDGDQTSTPSDHHTYAIDSVELGGRLDELASSLSAASGGVIDVQELTTAQVETGRAPVVAHLQAQDFVSGRPAAFATYVGVPNDGPGCPQDISPDSPRDARVVGTTRVGRFLGDRGDLLASVSFTRGAPIVMTLVDASALIESITRARLRGGSHAGAIVQDDLDNEVVPALVAAIGAAIVADCDASCACLDGSIGGAYQALLDDDGDCAVTQVELRSHPVFEDGLALDTDTDEDGAVDALSVELRFSAVTARVDGL